jgi:hypothetical protein
MSGHLVDLRSIDWPDGETGASGLSGIKHQLNTNLKATQKNFLNTLQSEVFDVAMD